MTVAGGSVPLRAVGSDHSLWWRLSHRGSWGGAPGRGAGKVAFAAAVLLASARAVLRALPAAADAARPESWAFSSARPWMGKWRDDGARFGARVIRGSSTHTGARALRDYYQLLVKDQVSPVITPDGPSGRGSSSSPAPSCWRRSPADPCCPWPTRHRAPGWSWDKFVIPRPFARIAIAIGAPVHVPRGDCRRSLERLQRGDRSCRRKVERSLHEPVPPGARRPVGVKFFNVLDSWLLFLTSRERVWHVDRIQHQTVAVFVAPRWRTVRLGTE